VSTNGGINVPSQSQCNSENSAELSQDSVFIRKMWGGSAWDSDGTQFSFDIDRDVHYSTVQSVAVKASPCTKLQNNFPHNALSFIALSKVTIKTDVFWYVTTCILVDLTDISQ
jgi:hypothetical protein